MRENKKKRKETTIMLLTIVLLLLFQSALAETTGVNEVSQPMCTYIDAGDPVRECMSQAELYVSEEEVWFSGTIEEGEAWIVKTTTRGSVLEQYIIPFDMPRLVY